MEFRRDITLGLKVPIYPPIFNGGGCCKTTEDVFKLSKSLAGAVLAGSYTKEERASNPGNIFYPGEGFALNALGIPNGGLPYLKKNLPEMASITHDSGKPLVVSIVGFNSDEFGELSEAAFEGGADAVELNLGCPNIIGRDGRRKSIPSYHVDKVDEILEKTERYVSQKAVVWVKVSPNPISLMIDALARRISAYDFVKAVTAINTWPNAYALDQSGKPRISVGLAGLSGPFIKPIGLGQVFQWRQALPAHVRIIGVGGICCGQDIKDYAEVGADGFQIATALLKGGDLNLHAFEQVALGYDQIPA